MQIADDFKKSLEKYTRESPYMPYLFLGSGLSRRYLGLPDWGGLLKLFSDELGKDFDYLTASHDNDLPTVASVIAEEFHDFWWHTEKYSEQKNKYRGKIKGKSGALKVAVSEYIKQKSQLKAGVPGVDASDMAEELRILSKVSVDGIITTNYDSLCEQIFPEFRPYIGQQELLLGDAQFIAEIYKIHGCISDANSLILTDADYKEFERGNAYLAAKLLTIFAENPIIFVGYSMNDKYLNEIIESISLAVDDKKINTLSTRFYLVEWNDDPDSVPVMETCSLERGGKRFPVTRIYTHSFKWIWEVLASLERSFSGPLLRQLREKLYDIVTILNDEPNREKVIALPLESPEAKGQKVVFGLGEFKGIDTSQAMTITEKILETDDLVMDVLEKAPQPMESSNILDYGIVKHIKARSNQYLPTWKYLQKSGRISADGVVNFSGLNPVIEALANNKITLKLDSYIRLCGEFKGSLPKIENKESDFNRDPELVNKLLESEFKSYFLVESLMWLVYLRLIDSQDFIEVVHKILPDLERTHRAKLACVYDRLVYSSTPITEFFSIKNKGH